MAELGAPATRGLQRERVMDEVVKMDKQNVIQVKMDEQEALVQGVV